MKKYFAVFIITLQEYFAYRLNMIMWRVRQVFVFLIPYFIWSAILSRGGELYGYDFPALMTYLFGTTILRSLVMGSRTADLGWMINSGYLTIPLMRPLSIFKFLFTRDIADKLFNLTFIFFEIPLMLLIFRPPVFIQTNPVTMFYAIASITMAVCIYFFINILFGTIAFWSRDVWAPRFFLMVVMEFATGATFPLDMMPALGQKIVFATPFPYLLFVPLKVYLGQDPSLYSHLLIQFVWLISLYFITKYVWNKGIKSYEAEGR